MDKSGANGPHAEAIVTTFRCYSKCKAHVTVHKRSEKSRKQGPCAQSISNKTFGLNPSVHKTYSYIAVHAGSMCRLLTLFWRRLTPDSGGGSGQIRTTLRRSLAIRRPNAFSLPFSSL